jgi:hypothetical protein
VLALAACVAPDGRMTTGESEQALIARWGQPTAVHAQPATGGAAAGRRLEFSGNPYGQMNWMADIDAQGKVSAAREVLTQTSLERLSQHEGQWARADVRREYGRPAEVVRVASWQGDIWTYRYREATFDLMYHVYFDSQGVLRRSHGGPDTWKSDREPRSAQ